MQERSQGKNRLKVAAKGLDSPLLRHLPRGNEHFFAELTRERAKFRRLTEAAPPIGLATFGKQTMVISRECRSLNMIQINTGRRQEMESVRFDVKEPFPRLVQLLEDVFHIKRRSCPAPCSNAATTLHLPSSLAQQDAMFFPID